MQARKIVRHYPVANKLAGLPSVSSQNQTPTTDKCLLAPERRLSVVPSSKFKRSSPQPEESLTYILAGTIIRLGGSAPVGVWKEIVSDGVVLFDESILFNAPSGSTLMLSIPQIMTGGAKLVREHIENHMREWEAGEERALQAFLAGVAYA